MGDGHRRVGVAVCRNHGVFGHEGNVKVERHVTVNCMEEGGPPTTVTETKVLDGSRRIPDRLRKAALSFTKVEGTIHYKNKRENVKRQDVFGASRP